MLRFINIVFKIGGLHQNFIGKVARQPKDLPTPDLYGPAYCRKASPRYSWCDNLIHH